MAAGRYRVTVQEAAKRLGVKEGAIRKRIGRGTLDSEKEGDRVYVYIDAPPLKNYDEERDDAGYGTGHPMGQPPGQDEGYPLGYDALVGSQQDQIAFLRRELEVWQEEARRKDHIIAALTERIPELEPAAEARNGHEKPSEDAGEDDPPEPQEHVRHHSWLFRLFFGT